MTNRINLKKADITLLGYYENLPQATYPKKEMIAKIMNQCNVSFTTAHNWVKGKTKPQDCQQLETLSKITGIPKERLWK